MKFINKIIRTLRPLLQDYLPEAKKTGAAPKVEEAPEEKVVPESKKNYEVLEDVLRHFSCQFEKEESDNGKRSACYRESCNGRIHVGKCFRALEIPYPVDLIEHHCRE